MSRMERVNKRLIAIIVLLIVLLVGSNIAWLIYESKYQDICIEAEQDGYGVNIVGGGDITYGPESENQDKS